MNAPDHHHQFLIPDGEPKVSFERETKFNNAGTFTIQREGHTLGNILRIDENVEPAGYKVAHPLENKTLVWIKTTSESSPVQAYNLAINDLYNELDHLKNEFEAELARQPQES